METRELYPLKFKSIFKDKIWGGNKLFTELQKKTNSDKCGESWEISGVEGNVSVVDNGFLAGNNLQELVEIYMGDLVGDSVYNRFGIEFPLLIKFIDANDVLSIQVHPDDKLAKERHNAFGKTEMWYIVQADEGSELITGFNQTVDKEIYLEHLNKKSIKDILNTEKVRKGDVFFIPAGRVHAIGAGILLAEIQQTSDVTYRIYDWDRVDDKGKERELHTDLALEAIDYKYYSNYKTNYQEKINETVNLVDCNYFTTNILKFSQLVEKDYNMVDSFIIYMCISGNVNIIYNVTENINLSKG
ncbi:MAG: type I phosphomannose isomerase catalytic subunit, partial [Bacteroidota bacterium]